MCFLSRRNIHFEFFQLPLFPVAMMFDVAAFHGYSEVDEGFHSSFNLRDIDKSSSSTKTLVWLARIDVCGTEANLDVVERQKNPPSSQPRILRDFFNSHRSKLSEQCSYRLVPGYFWTYLYRYSTSRPVFLKPGANHFHGSGNVSYQVQGNPARCPSPPKKAWNWRHSQVNLCAWTIQEPKFHRRDQSVNLTLSSKLTSLYLAVWSHPETHG